MTLLHQIQAEYRLLNELNDSTLPEYTEEMIKGHIELKIDTLKRIIDLEMQTKRNIKRFYSEISIDDIIEDMNNSRYINIAIYNGFPLKNYQLLFPSTKRIYPNNVHHISIDEKKVNFDDFVNDEDRLKLAKAILRNKNKWSGLEHHTNNFEHIIEKIIQKYLV